MGARSPGRLTKELAITVLSPVTHCIPRGPVKKMEAGFNYSYKEDLTLEKDIFSTFIDNNSI